MLKISIIIPVYNHNRELKKCLRSILKQTYRDFEIIIVNDGSLIAETQKIEKLHSRFHSLVYETKIKLVYQKHSGANAARNRGFRESGEKYLLFCDADIIMKPEMLETMFQTLESHPEASYVYSSFKFGWKKFKSGPFDAEKLKKINYIPTTSLIRREHFPGFDENIKRFQDWDLWLTMLEEGCTGIWIPKTLFKANPHRTGKSKWLPKIFYKIPWQRIGYMPPSIKKYKYYELIIKQKHGLPNLL